MVSQTVGYRVLKNDLKHGCSHTPGKSVSHYDSVGVKGKGNVPVLS
jgi:hypothetical protein